MKMIEKWELLEEKDISPSKWFPLFLQKIKLPDGRILDDYYISKLSDVGMVMAISKDNEVFFVRQYKQAAGDILLEFPAGWIENKTPEEGARIELEQETGIRAEKMEFLGMSYQSASKITTKVYYYLVRDAEISTNQILDENEEIEIIKIPAKEIQAKVMNAEINCSDTLACLYFARIKYPELFE